LNRWKRIKFRFIFVLIDKLAYLCSGKLKTYYHSIKEMATTLYIKNMVCNRCKMAVEKTLKDQGLHPLAIELGEVVIEDDLRDIKREELRSELESVGFELLDDKREQIIDLVKTSIIRLVHYRDNNSTLTLSDFISSELHQDYSSLSKLFSEVEGKTIERYYIEQRIERVKELIKYDELSLTQIALKMKYSSVAYLSSQFKSVTGMTPSQFKVEKKNLRKGLDEV